MNLISESSFTVSTVIWMSLVHACTIQASTINLVQVGNEVVKGISGGERKRLSLGTPNFCHNFLGFVSIWSTSVSQSQIQHNALPKSWENGLNDTEIPCSTVVICSFLPSICPLQIESVLLSQDHVKVLISARLLYFWSLKGYFSFIRGPLFKFDFDLKTWLFQPKKRALDQYSSKPASWSAIIWLCLPVMLSLWLIAR